MADPRRDPDADRVRKYEREPTTGIPRWVKVAVLVAAVLVLLVVIANLLGGGGHGPSRHF
jgi:hypothetical protein